VIAIIAILLALLMAGVQKARAAAERAECASKMRQLGLALHSYHDVKGSFPIQAALRAQYTRERAGQDGSWMYKILPHIEQEALYRQAINDAPGLYVDPASRKVTLPNPDSKLYWDTWATPVPAFLCPSDPRPLGELVRQNPAGTLWAMISYVGVSGRNSWEDTDGIFGSSNLSVEDPQIIENPPKTSVRISQITRGLSNTVVVGERPPGPLGPYGGLASQDLAYFFGAWAVAWWESSLWGVGDINMTKQIQVSLLAPQEVCPDRAYFSQGDIASYCHLGHFWSFHSGGANWLLADGSVQFMTYDAGQTVIPEMASIK
jgi:prepilin-type processing-associated H-X9-DG protein